MLVGVHRWQSYFVLSRHAYSKTEPIESTSVFGSTAAACLNFLQAAARDR